MQRQKLHVKLLILTEPTDVRKAAWHMLLSDKILANFILYESYQYHLPEVSTYNVKVISLQFHFRECLSTVPMQSEVPLSTTDDISVSQGYFFLSQKKNIKRHSTKKNKNQITTFTENFSSELYMISQRTLPRRTVILPYGKIMVS